MRLAKSIILWTNQDSNLILENSCFILKIVKIECKLAHHNNVGNMVTVYLEDDVTQNRGHSKTGILFKEISLYPLTFFFTNSRLFYTHFLYSNGFKAF